MANRSRVGYFDGPEDSEPESGGSSLESVAAGGIPLEAQRRLQALAREGSPFTSTLGVGEFALLGLIGPTPVAQALGASVHQVGWQLLPSDAQWGGEVYCELDQVMHAWDQARRRAFDRLSEEARLVRADAVLGVRLRRGEHDWARGTVDYLVSGTAVRLPGAVKATWPILTDLTVQEYWKLYQAGWSPVGLVAATSVFFVSQSMGTQWMRRLTAVKNQELTEYSRGFYAARATAVRYLQSQASAAGASGIVGVQLEHDITREKFRVATGYYPQGIAYSAQRQQGAKDERDGLAVTIHAVGTAIRHDEPVQRYPPEPIVNLQEV